MRNVLQLLSTLLDATVHYRLPGNLKSRFGKRPTRQALHLDFVCCVCLEYNTFITSIPGLLIMKIRMSGHVMSDLI